MYKCVFNGNCKYRNKCGNCRKNGFCAMRQERTALKRGMTVRVEGMCEYLGLSKYRKGYISTFGTLTEDPNVMGYAHVTLMNFNGISHKTVNLRVYQSGVTKI